MKLRGLKIAIWNEGEHEFQKILMADAERTLTRQKKLPICRYRGNSWHEMNTGEMYHSKGKKTERKGSPARKGNWTYPERPNARTGAAALKCRKKFLRSLLRESGKK